MNRFTQFRVKLSNIIMNENQQQETKICSDTCRYPRLVTSLFLTLVITDNQQTL